MYVGLPDCSPMKNQKATKPKIIKATDFEKFTMSQYTEAALHHYFRDFFELSEKAVILSDESTGQRMALFDNDDANDGELKCLFANWTLRDAEVLLNSKEGVPYARAFMRHMHE